jgi:pimeloyl-ACP methyl ester carboxylesterase
VDHDERGRVPLYWIGGWASDLQCWDGLLNLSYPEFDIRFVDAHSVLSGESRLEHLLAVAPPGSCVAGWSLGGLLLENLLRQGRVPPEMPVLSICPFLDFCDPAGPWKPLVLRRMVRRLFGDAAGTLSDFGDRMGLEGDERAGWFQQAMELGEERLADGLETLQSLRLEGPWASHPRRLFVVSPDDPVSPPCEVPREVRRTMPAGSGHVPFLRHPDAFRSVLLELALPS